MYIKISVTVSNCPFKRGSCEAVVGLNSPLAAAISNLTVDAGTFNVAVPPGLVNFTTPSAETTAFSTGLPS